MHGLPIPRQKLNGFDVAPRRYGDVHHKVSIHILATGGQRISFRHRDNQVGPAELPTFGPLRCGWQIRGQALYGAFRHPLLDGADLIGTQASFAREFHVSGLSQPRRHVTLPGDFGYLFRVLLGLRISQ